MNRSRFDTNSKAVLIVIPACPVWLCLDWTQFVEQSDAQVKLEDAENQRGRPRFADAMTGPHGIEAAWLLFKNAGYPIGESTTLNTGGTLPPCHQRLGHQDRELSTTGQILDWCR